MPKNVRYTGFLILIFAILIGCEAAMKPEQEQAAVQQAMATGTEYFKNKYHLETEWKEHQFQPESASSHIALYGHVKDKPGDKIYILINYKTFEVISSVHPKEEITDKK